MTAPVQVGPSTPGGPTPYLTPRLLQVLELAASGHNNKAIGEQLGITENTVKTQMKTILRRLHVDDRAHAVALGLRLGLVSVDAVTIPRALLVVREDA